MRGIAAAAKLGTGASFVSVTATASGAKVVFVSDAMAGANVVFITNPARVPAQH